MALPLLKWLLWLIAAFHVFVGLSLNLSLTVTSLIARGYGARVDWTPQFVTILKPLGAFMVVLGLFAAVAARDPLAHVGIVLGFGILFVIRALQRAVFIDEIRRAFVIPPTRSLAMMGIMLGLAAAVFGLYRVAARGQIA